MDLLKSAGRYLLARAGEASTWATLLASLAAEIGVHLNPDLNTALVHLGVAAATFAGVLVKEGWQAKAKGE